MDPREDEEAQALQGRCRRRLVTMFIRDCVLRSRELPQSTPQDDVDLETRKHHPASLYAANHDSDASTPLYSPCICKAFREAQRFPSSFNPIPTQRLSTPARDVPRIKLFTLFPLPLRKKQVKTTLEWSS